jgi:signal transduction histidine kinase
VAAIAHEVRNPLTTIRAFANLLPESYDDEEFRERFGRLVNEGVERIEAVLARLQDLSNLPDPATEQFDTAELLESLLDARRRDIQARRLLVLKEFDRSHPLALGDATSLHSAIDGLLTRALSLVPERGDVYLASHHHPAGLRGGPSMRILLRYNNPRARSPATTSDTPRVEGVSLVENAIEFVVADWVIRSQGGTLVIDTTDSHESVIVIDLPAPSSA